MIQKKGEWKIMQHTCVAYPTMITPYESDGSVAYQTAARYVRWYYKNGCQGIFFFFFLSEIAYLTLEERVRLNRIVYEEAARIEKEEGKHMTVVSSGHTGFTLREQAYELNRIAESGTDALILITNRLDIENQGDDVWIKNAEKLLAELPSDINLGLYECPLPYKRLVSPRILRWCLSTGRFRFMKDTCCNAAMIRERLEILRGSNFALLNANGQTLLSSLRDGGSGYCGVMCNFHPALYVWLCAHYTTHPALAEEIQAFLGTACFTEGGLPYPLSAKYHMCLEGIPTELLSRVRKSEELTEYAKACVEQLRSVGHVLEKRIGGQR